MERKGAIDLSTARVISDTFFFSASKIVVLVLKPFKGVIIGRILGPTLYGILNLPVPYVQIFSILSNIGFSTAAAKLIPDYLQRGRADLARMVYRSSLALTLALSTVWCVLLVVFAPQIVERFAHQPDAVNPMRVYAIIIPFLTLNAFFSVAYMAVQRGKLGAGISLVYGLLNVALPVAAVLWRLDVTTVVGGILAAEVAATILFAFYFQRNILAKLGEAVGPLWQGIRETVSFGFIFFFANLGWNMINAVDRLFIQRFIPSADALGYYSMGGQVINVLNVVASTIGIALIPSLTAARSSNDQAAFRRLITSTSRLGFMTLVPAVVAIFVLAGDLFEVLLQKFALSVPVVQILVFIGFVDLYCRIGWAALVACGRGGPAALAYILGAAWNVAWCWALIPPYGIEGAAVATLSTFVVTAILLQAMQSRATGPHVSLRIFVHPALLSLAYVALGLALRGAGPVVRLAVVGVAGSALYVVLALATGLVRGEDIARVREILAPRAHVAHVRLALRIADFIERARRFLKPPR